MRTLYLLGNGFDLACGLKSRYADYFESRFKWYKGYNSSDSKAIPAIYKEIQDGGIKNIPSAWFIVLPMNMTNLVIGMIMFFGKI